MFLESIGISIWLNRVEREQGPRFFRSVTINARRCRAPKTSEWKDAASFRPVDLATLEMALQCARVYIESTSLPGQPVEGEEYEELKPGAEIDEEPAS